MSFITQEGLEKLKKELHELKTTTRQEIARRIQEAKELGDLSENAEYVAAKEAQSLNDRRILELEKVIKEATTIKKEEGIVGIVQIGSTIVVENNKTTKQLTIVGSNEADPTQGKISNESPLGKAFLGHKTGDEVEIKVPSGVTKYKILEIK